MKIKKYACHRIYVGGESFLTQSVVSVTFQGEVTACLPLSEEIPATEWLGGIIVLSNQKEIACRPDFRTWIHGLVIDKQLPVYAWHITNFNFQQESLTEQSIIRRL